MKHTTAVIPVYNEEKTLAGVLRALKKSKYINDILVINDGSTDSSLKIAKKYNINIINLKRNLGKSEAIKKICANMDTDIIFFCDADLIRFKPSYADKIIEPVVKGKAVMSLGFRIYLASEYFKDILPAITGERAILNSVFQEIIQSNYFSGWGMELVMNEYCRRNNLPVCANSFNYRPLIKTEKHGYKAIKSLIMEFFELTSIFIYLRILGRF